MPGNEEAQIKEQVTFACLRLLLILISADKGLVHLKIRVIPSAISRLGNHCPGEPGLGRDKEWSSLPTRHTPRSNEASPAELQSIGSLQAVPATCR